MSDDDRSDHPSRLGNDKPSITGDDQADGVYGDHTRFNLRLLFAIVAVVACVVGLGAELTRRAAKQRQRDQISRCLDRLGELFRFYENPPGLPIKRPWPPRVAKDDEGQKLYSWRLPLIAASILHMDEMSIGPNYSSAWDSGANVRYSNYEANFFRAGSDDGNKTTRIYAIAGADAAFDDAAATSYAELPPNLIVLTEIADSKTHWMQPGDYDVTTLLAATGRLGDTVKGLLPDRIHVLFADGEVWALSPDTPIDAVKPFFTITGAKAASREESLSKYRVD